MLQMNVPGTGGASIQPRGDFTCSPPTSSCSRIVKQPVVRVLADAPALVVGAACEAGS